MRIEGTDIYMVRGDTEAITIELMDSSGERVELVDGDTIYLTVKTNVKTEHKELQKIVRDFPNGVANIFIDPEDTKPMRFRGYVYDVQLTRSNGDVKTIVDASKFTIEPEVTYE